MAHGYVLSNARKWTYIDVLHLRVCASHMHRTMAHYIQNIIVTRFGLFYGEFMNEQNGIVAVVHSYCIMV